MHSSPHTPKQAPTFTGRRLPPFRVYLKNGGINGLVRRLIRTWKFPFTVNQLKVAFHQQHPELHLGDFQIDDILSYMVQRGQLMRLADGSFQWPQPLQEAA